MPPRLAGLEYAGSSSISYDYRAIIGARLVSRKHLNGEARQEGNPFLFLGVLWVLTCTMRVQASRK